MDKTLVVVSKLWQEPFIRIDVTHVGLGITMTMDDFLQALEIESKTNLRSSCEKIISEMKEQTNRVM